MTSILRLPALIIRRGQCGPCLHERAFRLSSKPGRWPVKDAIAPIRMRQT
jgi:hypothetical protein